MAEIIPRDKMPVVCCRVGDPEWVENDHSGLSNCQHCEFPVHITNATLQRAKEAPNAMIVCVNCARAHFDATGRKFAPVKPDEGQLAEGNTLKSGIVHAICLNWLESERGWGQRPDGFSLHLTLADCSAYRDAYWEGMPDEPPEEYSKEAGEPFNVAVRADIYELLREHKSLRSYLPWPAPNTIVEAC